MSKITIEIVQFRTVQVSEIEAFKNSKRKISDYVVQYRQNGVGIHYLPVTGNLKVVELG